MRTNPLSPPKYYLSLSFFTAAKTSNGCGARTTRAAENSPDLWESCGWCHRSGVWPPHISVSADTLALFSVPRATPTPNTSWFNKVMSEECLQSRMEQTASFIRKNTWRHGIAGKSKNRPSIIQLLYASTQWTSVYVGSSIQMVSLVISCLDEVFGCSWFVCT